MGAAVRLEISDSEIFRIMGEASLRTRKPLVLSRVDLSERIISACADIGIKDVIVMPNDGNRQVGFVDGVVKERKYFDFSRTENVIGYLRKDRFSYSGRNVYTIFSFKYEPESFSSRRLPKFLEALSKKGLEAHKYQPFSIVFPTEKEIIAPEERIRNRAHLYK